MLSVANASDTKLMNMPKNSIFIKFYRNQGLGKIFIFGTTRP